MSNIPSTVLSFVYSLGLYPTDMHKQCEVTFFAQAQKQQLTWITKIRWSTGLSDAPASLVEEADDISASNLGDGGDSGGDGPAG